MEDRDAQLRKILEKVEENNEMLHRLQSAMRYSRFFSLVKWVIIIGSFVVAYQYTLPYLDTMLNMYNNVQKQYNAVQGLPTIDPKNLPSIPGLENLLKNYQAQQKVPTQTK